MGMGSFGAGTSPAGLDNQTPTERAARRPPAALAFDGLKKDFTLNSDGLYEAAHPVDAKVFLKLRTAATSIRSAVTTGNRLIRLGYIDRASIQRTVEDEVDRVLTPELAAGEISGVEVEVDVSVRGRLHYLVAYFNMVTRRRVGPQTFNS